MNKTFCAMLAVAATIAFPALAEEVKKDVKAEPAKDYTVIKVGGDDIRMSEVSDIWKGLFPGGAAPDFNSFEENIRQNVLRGLISERLIYGEAVKAGTDKDPEVKKRLESLERQVVMQSFMEKKAVEMVTDDQVRAAYDAKAAASKGQEELRAKHILVATEEEAKKLSEQLKKGGDFDKLAKEQSTDKGSGANGGELGWFTKEKMVPAFADAASKLKKDEISAPVKSEFGWHIIKLEDRRPLKMASFEDMKDSLKGEVGNTAMQSYVESLLKKADIKYYGQDGKEKPFTIELAPAAGKVEEKK